jgi:glycosyltransferase involved in cell wall biosynthesis
MPQKNHAFLLDIAKEVIKARPEVRFLLIGDGPLRSQMEARARELGIHRNVVFAGARADVPRLMLGAMDGFVLPSLWEGLGLVVVEAQAAGLRGVVSEAVPLEAFVLREGVEHVPVSAGAHHWASRLLKAMEQGRIPFGEALAGVARSTFAVENSCRYLAGLYSQPR